MRWKPKVYSDTFGGDLVNALLLSLPCRKAKQATPNKGGRRVNQELAAALSEQIRLMRESADSAEQGHGHNITSIRLRQFADRIENTIEAHVISVSKAECGCCGPWIRNDHGAVSEHPTQTVE